MRPRVTLIVAVALGSCLPQGQSKPVAGLACNDDNECDPPTLVCSDDGICAGGCVVMPGLCGPGSVCDSATSRCMVPDGGARCEDDSACNAPSSICESGACVSGCANGGACYSGWSCDENTGYCSAPVFDGGTSADAGVACRSDVDCGPPDLICLHGTCALGCTKNDSLCDSGWSCDVGSGHCHPPAIDGGSDGSTDGGFGDAGMRCTSDQQCAPDVCVQGACVPSAGSACAQDMDCTATQACTRAGVCVAVPLDKTCGERDAGCPTGLTCKDDVCFNGGFCVADADCPASQSCQGGLCFPTISCSAAAVADILAGHYSSGREVCISGHIVSAFVESEQDVFIRLADTANGPTLTLEITPPYRQAGVTSVGASGQAIGTVRYDRRHKRWEVQPVKYLR